MKKLFAAILLLTAIQFVPGMSIDTRAQIVKKYVPVAAEDTLVNTDTAYVVIPVDNISRSVEAHIKRVSGTAAGSVSFEGTVDGTNFEVIGTYTITNVATQVKVFPLRNANGDLVYASYRLVFYPTGTNSIIPSAYLLRRNY